MNYPFTVEEINLICMYSRDNRQKAIDGLYHAMASQQDSDMIMLIYQTITKLSCMSNYEFKELNLVPVYE